MIDVICINNVSLHFGKRILFEDVNLKFTNGNCYGIIGANGAGKTTFLKLLTGELETTKGDITIGKGERLAYLEQDHYKYDDDIVLDVVLKGNPRLYQIMKEKEELYSKEVFTEEDGILLGNLEGEFAEMDGWNAESDAEDLLNNLGIPKDIHYNKMKDIKNSYKVKVLLAKALFQNPDILLLDEPTNNLDLEAINWLEEFLINYPNTVIVVSHDRYFLNKVCTHIVDIDYSKMKLYIGNYDFWYESSQLLIKQIKEQNKKKEEKIKELKDFIARFSANHGKDILTVRDLVYEEDGRRILDKISFTVQKDDKIAFVGTNNIAKTILFNIIMKELKYNKGEITFGKTIKPSYFPIDNTKYFNNDQTIIDFLAQYGYSNDPQALRSFLGRMLFSSDEVFKKLNVLSGGEKARVMLSKMMLESPNFLILDEPTNHLDLESITSLNKGLENFEGEILIASHDHELISTVCNRIIEILPDGKIRDMRCDYDTYLVKSKEEV